MGLKHIYKCALCTNEGDSITIYEVKAIIGGSVEITDMDFESKAQAEKYRERVLRKHPHCKAVVVQSQEKRMGITGVK